MTTFENARPLLEQWNTSHAAIYHIRESDLRWNLTEQDLVDYDSTSLFGVPSLVAIATPAGVRAGLSASNFWVPLWGAIPSGLESNFVQAMVKLGTSLQRTRLVFGADEFHFLPGIPLDEAGRRLTSAVIKAGFDGADAFDFTGDLSQIEVTDAIHDAEEMRTRQGWRFSTVECDSDLNALAAFLSREFPGRWAREFSFWRSRQDTGRALWNILRLEGDEILGFARLAVRGRVTPLEKGWTPGALRMPFNQINMIDHGDGCLGPIGVAASQRGKGAGRVLLGLVLQALRQNHANQICIDWTNALKYYEPLHFKQARQYWTAWMIGPS